MVETMPPTQVSIMIAITSLSEFHAKVDRCSECKLYSIRNFTVGSRREVKEAFISAILYI